MKTTLNKKQEQYFKEKGFKIEYNDEYDAFIINNKSFEISFKEEILKNLKIRSIFQYTASLPIETHLFIERIE